VRNLKTLCVLCVLVLAVMPSMSRGQDAPVYTIAREHSWIKFHVKATTTIAGKFKKWDASLTFASAEESTGLLSVKIQADGVDTGSGIKDGKLKGKDFFDAEHNPTITFVSNKIVKTAPNTYEVDGDFTIRGVSNPEKLTLTVSHKGGGEGDIKGTMVFNRKDYGMNKGILFITIADHVDVSFHFAAKHISGPPLLIQ
jgi:polyisoprenoid-binding protein YceI